MKQNESVRRHGFTLIELLLVLAILAILAGLVVPKFVGQTEKARISGAKADISMIKTALNMFEQDTGRFPTSEEGLNALVEKPGDVQGWTKPYLEKVNRDPWQHPYVYRCPGSGSKDFDLFSCGPDGHEGGGDDVEP
jgi:general secretion pathway protein G